MAAASAEVTVQAGDTEQTVSTFRTFIENKIELDLSFYYWKKYIAAAFWSNMHMPINLCITLLTAITTTQSAAIPFLTQETATTFSIVTLILSVLNTYFQPYKRMTSNLDSTRKWNELGAEYEDVYYSEDRKGNLQQQKKCIARYRDIKKKADVLRTNEGPDSMNFITDILHIIADRLQVARIHQPNDGSAVLSCCSRAHVERGGTSPVA
jgi:hypothetical protein